ncbi:bleomycin resistance protein [Mycobacterium sp. IS-1496]|uniref:VOC family protein n=1 Tax=Mycobacterium sp. IS-1496 TaxID=1772284 RepID=UPI0007415C61|nr:VOC family protein [Mycobacterium sp. IS-1496]KUI38734.1 bleomycin resistance protein [Mycobacterium sp. IS-1496]
MSPPLSAADLYHIGVVVADVDAAAARLTAVAGYRWTRPMEYTVPVVTSTGPLDVPFRISFSVEPPHLELVQEVPGTLWAAAPGRATHHLGYWVDDVETTSKLLSDSGFAFEAGPAADQPPTFAYHVDAAGTRVEIVNRGVFGDWTAFLQSMAT